MRIAMVLTPPSELHFRLASQVGVTDFVARYPAVDTPEKMAAECERAASFGLKLSVVEGYIPIDDIIHAGSERDRQIEAVQQTIEAMGRNGVEVLCYNFMPHSDWTRTSFDEPERGGAVSNGFDLSLLKGTPPAHPVTSEFLWNNLSYFLERVLPVAEASGVKLAMHPDDPPLHDLLGAEQIMHQPEHFERLFELFANTSNGMCFCQGTFAEMGADIPALIQRFGQRIHYVHFRDVRLDKSSPTMRFSETFHDNGDTDMAAAMRAYRGAGFNGMMRPDHVPKLEGEAGIADGYSMLGRLFAAGYMRGLMHATETLVAH